MVSRYDFLAHTGDGTFIIDKNQRIISWNAAAEEVLGYTAAEACGQRCWMLLQGCSAGGQLICQCDGAILAQARNGLLIRHFHLLVKHRLGHRLLIDVSTIPIYGDDENQWEGLAHLFRLVEEVPEPQILLRIYLLGPVTVRRTDGSMVGGTLWQRTKVRALLALLALRGHPIHREQLIDRLWPEQPYEAALRNLNTTIYNLRRSLEPELSRSAASRYILYEGGQYALASETMYWVDVHAFSKLLRKAQLEPDAHQAVRLYQEAIELYDGDYLSDLQLTAVYSAGEHHQLNEQHLQALEALGRLYETIGEKQTAEQSYLKALSLDPCRESATQRLMRLYLWQNNHVAAARACRQLIIYLAEELDMAPSEETRRLCVIARCQE
jgi:DNA-binding SARP family transcriptional activator